MRNLSVRSSQPSWLLSALLIVITVLSLTPSLRLMLSAFAQFGVGEQSPFLQVMSAASTWRALGHSLYTAILGALLSLFLGAIFAYSVTLTNIRCKQWLVFCFMLPMMIPPQITALSWLQLMGPASPLLNTLGIAPPMGSPQPLYSAEGIILLLGIQSAPLVFLAMRTSLINLPADLIEAARVSGASSRRVWRDIVIPLSRGGMIAGVFMAFVSNLGNFGIPAMLGIPSSYYVLPTLIYQRMAGFGNSVLQEVASLSILIGVMALLGVALQQRMQKGSRYALTGHSGKAHDLNLHRWRPLLEAVLATVLFIILVCPLLALIVSALVPAVGVPLTLNTITLTAFDEMINHQGSTLRAGQNSLMLAGGAALVIMACALPLAYRLKQLPERIQTSVVTVMEIPYALPGVVLAIACILLFARPLPIINVVLYGSLWIIFLAYLARFLVLGLRPVMASLGQVDAALEEAAQLAGASTLRRLVDILMPMLAPAVFAGGLLVFLIALNEITVSALLWSAGNETLGVLIFNLDEGGESVLASAISVLVVLFVALLMALLNLLAPKLPKGVIPWRT